jgi:hypothetical protein
MIKMLVTNQNDVSLVCLRHLEGVSVNKLRAFDAEGVVRNAAELQVHQFHRQASNRFIRLSRRLPLARRAAAKDITIGPCITPNGPFVSQKT